MTVQSGALGLHMVPYMLCMAANACSNFLHHIKFLLSCLQCHHVVFACIHKKF